MRRYSNISVVVDMGKIPPISKMPFKMNSIGSALDMGRVPPKNYFRERIATLAVAIGEAAAAEMSAQVI